MAITIAISNQKGGVGKTTSAVSISAELALMGKKVLLIDMDPQGSASSGLGVPFPTEGQDLYDVFFGAKRLGEIIKRSPIELLHVAPSSRDLISLEIELGKQAGRELILSTELAALKGNFDYVLIDCPPSSGLLTLNALGAAEQVAIPLQAEYYALEGLSQLMNTIEFVRHTFNSKLQILGVFMTMFDARTNLSVQVEREAATHFGPKMCRTRIPRNIRLSEAPSHGLPICLYDPSSAGAKAYHELSLELIDRTVAKEAGKLAVNG